MMKVLYVSTSHRMGGAENSLLTLSGSIYKEEITPIFASPENPDLLQALNENNTLYELIDIRPFQPVSLLVRGRKVLNPPAVFVNLVIIWSVIRQLREIIRKHSIDIIHANDLLADIAAGFAAKREKKPSVWYLRDNISKGIKRAVFDILGVRFSTKIVAVSNRTRAILNRSIDKALVIYNGVELERFSADGSAATAENTGDDAGERKVIGMVGRISEAKGFETFLYAARKIVNAKSDVRFHIVGGPVTGDQERYYNKLKTLSAELELDNFVHFLGQRKDMPGVYADMDILMLPSMREALPRTLIESQVSGTALIASNVGGAAEIIEDGVSGFLVGDWKDSDAFAERAIRLLKDPELLEKMKKSGRESVEAKFDIRNVVVELACLYREIGE